MQDVLPEAMQVRLFDGEGSISSAQDVSAALARTETSTRMGAFRRFLIALRVVDLFSQPHEQTRALQNREDLSMISAMIVCCSLQTRGSAAYLG